MIKLQDHDHLDPSVNYTSHVDLKYFSLLYHLLYFRGSRATCNDVVEAQKCTNSECDHDDKRCNNTKSANDYI
jgi:hypothetical protein